MSRAGWGVQMGPIGAVSLPPRPTHPQVASSWLNLRQGLTIPMGIPIQPGHPEPNPWGHQAAFCPPERPRVVGCWFTVHLWYFIGFSLNCCMLASSTGVRMHRARAWGEGQGEASAVKMGWGGLSLRTCFPPKVLKKQGNGSKITESSRLEKTFKIRSDGGMV